MNRVDKLQADRERHKQALAAGLDHAGLLREQVERVHLLSRDSAQDLIATRLIDGDNVGSANDTTTLLLETARAQHALALDERLGQMQAAMEQLQLRKALLDKQQDELLQRNRQKQLSLAEAIADDERLAGMSEAEILEEFRTKASVSSERENRLRALSMRRRATEAAAAAANAYHEGAESDADDELDSSEGDAPWLTSESNAVQRNTAQPDGVPQALQHLNDVRRRGLATTGADLDMLVGAVKQSLPEQQERVSELKRKAVSMQARLKHYDRAGTAQPEVVRTANPNHRSIRAIAQSILKGVIEAAMHHVDMRPTREHVAREVAEWRHSRLDALMTITRHLGDSVVKQVVDELIGEVALEVLRLQDVADTFAFDLLVEAVAFSQGKYDVAGARDAGKRLQDAQLLADAHQHGQEDTYDEELDFDAGSKQRGVIMAGDARIDVEEEDVYRFRRRFDDGKLVQRRDEASLYLAGLKSMLKEMRRRRPPDTPYGHTQHLQVHFSSGARISKAQRLAIGRMRPPLAAAPSVWRRRETPVSKIEAGGFPRADHWEASGRVEGEFWGAAELRPKFLGLGPKGPVPGTSSLRVDPALGPITAMAACPSGAFLAVGTGHGAVVWDMRMENVGPPWFQVLGEGAAYAAKQSSWWQRKREPKALPAIIGFAWSADNYQLAALDAASTLRLWWMRPERSGAQQDVSVQQRKAVVPELAVSVSPFMMSISGKAPIEEELEGSADSSFLASAAAAEGTGAKNAEAARQAAAERAKALLRQQMSRQWRPAFHPSFTITGTQPSILMPQVTGDVVRIQTKVGGPVLPGFGPSTFAERAAVRRAALSQATVDFLMPPQVNNPNLECQALYRCHNAQVVFIGFLSDAATMVTVDLRGEVALWPNSDSDRTGFGWFVPKKRYQMPRGLRNFHPRGTPHPVWPAGPSPKLHQQQQRAKAGGFFSRGQPLQAPPRVAYDPDADDEKEAQLLASDPKGSFLLKSRLLWLVRYRAMNGHILREEVHRPMDSGNASARSHVIDTYDAATGELLLRSKQRCACSRMPYRVIAADMTPSKRDLLLFCHVPGQPDDPDSFSTISVSVLNIAAMRVLVPRIDVIDCSTAAGTLPAYALSPTITALGSEYLIMGLGCGVLGVHSLATGQLVREIPLGIPCPSGHYSVLTLMTVNARHGAFGNSGRTLLAVAPAGTQSVHVFELDTLSSVQAALKQRGKLVSGYAQPVKPAQPVVSVAPQAALRRLQPLLAMQRAAGGVHGGQGHTVHSVGPGAALAAGSGSAAADVFGEVGEAGDDDDGDDEGEYEEEVPGMQDAHAQLLAMQEELKKEAQQRLKAEQQR